MKMSKTRLYVEKKLSANMLIYIKNKQHHFLKNVLRIKIQDNILIFDGLTGEWLSKVISINRDNVVLQVLKKTREIKSETDLWLIFAPIKLFRMNITIQKATELGISRFIPCITQNTNQPKINIRNLKMNIIEASEQSERLSLPLIDSPTKLETLVENFPKDRCLIFCNENHENLPMIYEALSNKITQYKKWAVIIGPEGGFSDEEIEKITSLPSTISVSLGGRILRSDTATTAAIFSLQSLVENKK
tara:strand:+ start:283 stop:1023 length:741 start_codon:yes stop_codon:yes gene_type:complete